jgi:hypothetical protein
MDDLELPMYLRYDWRCTELFWSRSAARGGLYGRKTKTDENDGLNGFKRYREQLSLLPNCDQSDA